MKFTACFFGIALAALLVFSCKPNSKTAESTWDYTIVPGERVGLITLAKSSREHVLAFYADSARVEEIYLGEGISEEGVVVFPDNPRNRMEIYWDYTIDPVRPVLIRIMGKGADWKTTDGITIGTSIAEVEKINGGPFGLFGFGWDYGGLVNDWNSGKMNPNLHLRFELGLEAEAPAEIMGDTDLKSDNPALTKFKAVVSVIDLSFPRSDLLPLLQGRWQSAADATYQIEFADNKLRHINDGKLTVETVIAADSGCRESACKVTETVVEGFCFIEKDDYGAQCNLVLSLDSATLEYTAIGSTGKSLVFTRIE